MNTKLITTKEELIKLLSSLGEVVAFDTETNGLKYYGMVLIGLSLSDGKTTAYIPFNHETLEQQLSLTEDVKLLLKKFFLSRKLVIAHNFVYDYKVLYSVGINLYNVKWYDTMVADHLINENRHHNLKNLVGVYFDEKDYSLESEEIKNFASVTLKKACEYASKDAYYTYKLYEVTKELLIKESVEKLFYKIEMPFLRAVAMMEINGVTIDWEKVSVITKELEEEIIVLEEQMLTLIGEPYTFQMTIEGKINKIISNYNINSTKDLITILYDKLGLPVIEKTPSGVPSTNNNTINKLINLSDGQAKEFLILLRKYRIVQKLLSAFFIPLPFFKDPDGRVRTHFIDVGTKTGRLSSNSPNLQQLPKAKKEVPIKVRECFIASKGYKMITCDYSGQEIAVMAHISNDPTLISALNNGQDLHLKIANQFYNLGIPEEKLYKNHPEYEQIKERFKEERSKAKTITFGLAYGKGAYGFSKDFGISEEEAQRIVDEFFNKFPKLKEAVDKAHNDVKNKGFVTSLTGRKRRFTPNEQGYYSNHSFRQSFNFLIQGFSADMIRIAAIKCLNLTVRNPEWDLRILFCVHDELGFEVKEEYAETAAKAIKEAFETAVKLRVKVSADVSIGDNYEEAK